MNINDITPKNTLDEMARAPKICDKCGLSMAANHWYKQGVGFQCKKENVAAFQAKQAAAGSTVDATLPAPPSLQAAPPTQAAPLTVSKTEPPSPGTQAPAASSNPQQPATPAPSADIPSLIRKWAAVVDTFAKQSRIKGGEFTIHPDNSVTVHSGGVVVLGKNWEKLPFKFRKVVGNFTWTGTSITSCNNMPDVVEDGLLLLNTNKITSFIGCPREVDSDVVLDGNPAASLEGIPRVIRGALHCNAMPQLKSLKGIDEWVDEIDGSFSATDGTVIESHVLGLLLIKGLTHVTLSNTGVSAILNKHLANESPDEFECQEELIAAGFSKFADL